MIKIKCIVFGVIFCTYFSAHATDNTYKWMEVLSPKLKELCKKTYDEHYEHKNNEQNDQIANFDHCRNLQMLIDCYLIGKRDCNEKYPDVIQGDRWVRWAIKNQFDIIAEVNKFSDTPDEEYKLGLKLAEKNMDSMRHCHGASNISECLNEYSKNQGFQDIPNK